MTKAANNIVRVLLVEDDPDDYYLTRELLSEADGQRFEIDWAKDFDSGLDAIKNCTHDAYLLDYRLGARNGVELVGEAVASGCKNPLILLTGAGDREVAMKALDAGASDYLVKGEFDAEKLERVILFSIEQKKAAERLDEMVAERTAQIEQANASLRLSEERYRALFSSAPMAVFVCDTDAVIQHCNAHAVKLWGREPICGVEQHCGSTKLWLPDGTLLPHNQSPVVNVLRTGVPAHNVEVFIERPDGSRLPVLVNFGALKNGDGEITGAITSFIDITERKRAEEEVKATNEELRRFNSVAVGRELRMIEMKKEVNELCKRVGETARYPLEFDVGAEPPKQI